MIRRERRVTAAGSDIYEAWLVATEAGGKTDQSLRRSFLFWLSARIAEDGLIDPAELLAAARRAVPQTGLKAWNS